VLRAAGETETTQENIQGLLQLDEGDPGFQLLTEEDFAAVIFFFFFTFLCTVYIMNFPIYFLTIFSPF
jgi:hypothetical protein